MAKRYDYLKKIEEFKDKYEDLKGKTITIVGLEGVGIVLAEALYRNGYNLRIIDKGRVYIEEMHGQTIYLEEDVTKFKAKQAKKRLESINSEVKVKAFHEELTQDTNYLLDSDLVIDCTNKKEASDVIADYCESQEIPVIYTGLEGSKGFIIVQQKASMIDKVGSFDIESKGLMTSTVFLVAGHVLTLVAKVLSNEEVKEEYVLDAWNLK